MEGLVLLPDNLLEVEGPVKQALQVHKKKKAKRIEKCGLLFATAGDKGVIQVWTSESPGPPCLCSCEPLTQTSAGSESNKMSDENSKEEEKEPGHVYTSLHHCQALNALCGVTHDHNIVLYDLPQFSRRKQVCCYLMVPLCRSRCVTVCIAYRIPR